MRSISPPRLVAIVGCGRLGALVAAQTSRAGWSVAIVDRDARAFELLPDHLVRSCVTGDGLQPETLARARLSEAHTLIAATESDRQNALIASLARALGVGHAVARIREPGSVDLGCIGVESVCPTTLAAAAVVEHVERARSPSAAKPFAVAIAGCGRLGSRLACLLRQAGHQIVVIEREPAVLERLRAAGFGAALVEGDATEPSVLRRARIEECELAIAATRDENVNLMVSLVAQRLFGVNGALAAVCDPEREDMYRGLGLSTVCPTVLGAEAIRGLVARRLGVEGPAA